MTISPEVIYGFNAISVRIAMVVFFRKRKTQPKIHIESQGSPSTLNNIKDEEKSWNTLWFKHILQGNSDQTMVLAHRKINRPMK